MVAYAKPQQRKEEESERIRVEIDQMKFVDLRFERRQVARLDQVYCLCLTFVVSYFSIQYYHGRGTVSIVG